MKLSKPKEELTKQQEEMIEFTKSWMEDLSERPLPGGSAEEWKAYLLKKYPPREELK